MKNIFFLSLFLFGSTFLIQAHEQSELFIAPHHDESLNLDDGFYARLQAQRNDLHDEELRTTMFNLRQECIHRLTLRPEPVEFGQLAVILMSVSRDLLMYPEACRYAKAILKRKNERVYNFHEQDITLAQLIVDEYNTI